MHKLYSLTVHFVVTLLWIVLSLYLIFLYAPQEATMGELQRIFYIHASSGWTVYTAYFIIFLGSIAYLWKRSFWADDLAYSAGEVDLSFVRRYS
jgi:heme exporter protein C